MIATASPQPYLPLMTAARLVRILTMLALLLAPLSMMGEHAAMAMPQVPASPSYHEQAAADQSAHCAEMSGESHDDDEPSPSGDCLSNCAVACSAIPPLGSAVADQALPPAMVQPLPLAGRIAGLHPESDDPPPRTA